VDGDHFAAALRRRDQYRQLRRSGERSGLRAWATAQVNVSRTQGPDAGRYGDRARHRASEAHSL
jgi:hypothetical protein